MRRIIGKTVMRTFRKDVTEVGGAEQLCVGQDGGCEAAVHAMVDMFNDDNDDSKGGLQIDASNAFNCINRKVLLQNIKITCPFISM